MTVFCYLQVLCHTAARDQRLHEHGERVVTMSRKLVIEEGQGQRRHGNDAGPDGGLWYGRELW
jgi:hypothetical protein